MCQIPELRNGREKQERICSGVPGRGEWQGSASIIVIGQSSGQGPTLRTTRRLPAERIELFHADDVWSQVISTSPFNTTTPTATAIGSHERGERRQHTTTLNPFEADFPPAQSQSPGSSRTDEAGHTSCCLTTQASATHPHNTSTMEAIAAAFLRPATRHGLTTTRTALKHQIRSKATSARAKRAANIPPHPSFLTPDAHLQQDTIIFNPPSATTSVYHTPFKFLPKNDPRRRANLASLFTSHFGAHTPDTISQMPHLRFSREKNISAMEERKRISPVTKAEVEELRALRKADPYKWTVRALSEKFDLPMTFVMAASQAPKEKADFEKRKQEMIEQKWTPHKRKAMEERKRRAEMLYRGEL